MMAARVETANGFTAMIPESLFATGLSLVTLRPYAVAPDGQRLLIPMAVDAGGQSANHRCSQLAGENSQLMVREPLWPPRGPAVRRSRGSRLFHRRRQLHLPSPQGTVTDRRGIVTVSTRPRREGREDRRSRCQCEWHVRGVPPTEDVGQRYAPWLVGPRVSH
jgi:hypothetical protein